MSHKYTDDLLHHPVEMLLSGEVRCKLCHGQWPDAITAFEHISTDHPRYAHEIRERYGIWIGPKRDEEYYGDQADLRDDDSFSSKSIFRRGAVARELRKRLPVNDLPYIEIFADMVRVKVPVMMLPPKTVGGERGLVYGMSPKAMARLRRTVAKVKDWEGVLFTTQTTHDPITGMKNGEVMELAKAGKYGRAVKVGEMSIGRYWKTKTEAFYKRLQRKFGDVAELWKLEFQKRGEPHNHSFLFKVLPVGPEDQLPLTERAAWKCFASDPQFRTQARTFQEKLEYFFEVTTKEKWKGKALELMAMTKNWKTDFLHAFRIWYAWNWYEVMGCQSDAHLLFGTWIEPIEDRDKAKSYITKYLGKVEKNREAIIDAIRDQHGDDQEAVELALAEYGILHTGRVWGVRGDLDTSNYYRVYLSARAFEHLRFLLVQWCRMRGRDGWRSTERFARYLSEAEYGFSILGLGMQPEQRAAGPPLIEHLIGFAYDLAGLESESALMSIVPAVAYA